MAFFTTSNQSQIYYHRSGVAGAQSVVFIHGLACDHSHWQNQVEQFEGNYDCLVLDLGGHGLSTSDAAHCRINTYSDDVIALIQHLSLASPILVGHSMGCRIAISAASKYADIAGLALVDSGAPLPQDELAEVLAQREQMVAAIGYETAIKTMYEAMFLDDSHPVLKQKIVQQALRLPPEIGQPLGRDLSIWEATEQYEALANIQCPIVGVCATQTAHDMSRVPMVEGEYSQWANMMLAHTPQIDIVNIPNTGHFVMQEQPAALNTILAQFFDSVSAHENQQ